jgi:chaperone required for assembly of F1-ATPase
VKRFYTQVSARPVTGGWQVHLDDRAMKTQGSAAQIVPSRALADQLAAEWDAQGDTIDPRSLPLRDLTDHAIDHIAADPARSVETLLKYADGETLCYRADPGTPLAAEQDAVWEPFLQQVEAQHGVRFDRIAGIAALRQPAATRDAIRARLTALDPFSLAAIELATTLSASICVALALLDDPTRARALWSIADLEQEWQARQWDWDAEAEAVRDEKRAGFEMAGRYLAALNAADA